MSSLSLCAKRRTHSLVSSRWAATTVANLWLDQGLTWNWHVESGLDPDFDLELDNVQVYVSGHIVCSSCRKNISTCPTCRRHLTPGHVSSLASGLTDQWEPSIILTAQSQVWSTTSDTAAGSETAGVTPSRWIFLYPVCHSTSGSVSGDTDWAWARVWAQDHQLSLCALQSRGPADKPLWSHKVRGIFCQKTEWKNKCFEQKI